MLENPTRITKPAVRESWLRGGPGTATHKRGSERFITLSWDEAEKLVADELKRILKPRVTRQFMLVHTAGRARAVLIMLKARFTFCLFRQAGIPHRKTLIVMLPLKSSSHMFWAVI